MVVTNACLFVCSFCFESTGLKRSLKEHLLSCLRYAWFVVISGLELGPFSSKL